MAGNRVESAGRVKLRAIPLVAALRRHYQQWWHLLMLFPIRPQRTRQGSAHHCVVGLRIAPALQGRDSRDLHQTILSDPDEVFSLMIAGSGASFVARILVPVDLTAAGSWPFQVRACPERGQKNGQRAGIGLRRRPGATSWPVWTAGRFCGCLHSVRGLWTTASH